MGLWRSPFKEIVSMEWINGICQDRKITCRQIRMRQLVILYLCILLTRNSRWFSNAKAVLFLKSRHRLCICFTSHLPRWLFFPHIAILIPFPIPSRRRTLRHIWVRFSWSDYGGNIFGTRHTPVTMPYHMFMLHNFVSMFKFMSLYFQGHEIAQLVEQQAVSWTAGIWFCAGTTHLSLPASRPALGHIQPLIQWVLGGSFLRVKPGGWRLSWSLISSGCWGQEWRSHTSILKQVLMN